MNKQLSPIDEAKLAHIVTPQNEYVMKLHSEIKHLVKENDELREQCSILKERNVELLEKVADYRKALKVLNFYQAFDAWMTEDE